MTEFEIRRVVVTCDAGADMQLASAAAAALASRHGAALHGIFFEDENLYRVAALDIAAHVSLSPVHQPAPLTGATLQEMLHMQSLVMRRALEAAAAQHQLAWSFGTLRASSANALPIGEGDILVVDAGTKPFSSRWRPRSPWFSAVIEEGNTVLLRRGHAGHGAVVLAPDDFAACGRLIRATLALSRQEVAIVVLMATSNVRVHMEQLRPSATVTYRFEQQPNEISGLVARLRQLDPDLVVSSASEGMPTKRALVEGTVCDLLIVK